MARKKGPPGWWRLGANHPDWTPDDHEGTGFDELVVDYWLHVEMMSDRDGWLQVGPLDINVRLDRAGRARVVTVDVNDDAWTEQDDPTCQRWTAPKRGKAG
jgi:hypothetical protein